MFCAVMPAQAMAFSLTLGEEKLSPMNIRDAKHTLTVTNADLSGSTFVDVNLSQARFADINFKGATFSNVNLSDVEIDDCDVTGMRIHGILVSELLAAHGRKA
jgi:uncharacterized protein YjbI with pentapeptide repeats